MNNIKVFCRLKPNTNGSSTCPLVVEKGSNLISIPQLDYQCQLDNIFDGSSDQEALSQAILPSMVSDIFKGYNCTLFVYGQTGSGNNNHEYCSKDSFLFC